MAAWISIRQFAATGFLCGDKFAVIVSSLYCVGNHAVKVMLAYLTSGDGGAFTPTQLRDQIAAAVKTGVLKPGQRLPTAREVAVELRINVHTVQQAYDALAKEGVLTLIPGQGSFVTSASPARSQP